MSDECHIDISDQEAHTVPMRLTDSTEVRAICGDKVIAIFEPGKPALLVDVIKHAANIFPCGWLVEDYFEGEHYMAECKAIAVGFENGFICVDGHSHRNDATYYDDDEIAGMTRNHVPFAANARSMSGNPV